MKTRIQTLHTTNENAIRQFLGKDGNILFFDIETTGLSPKNASVYLIGAAVIEDKKWTLHQWFAENTAEEEAILDAFLQFSVPYKKLVHFNGTTFDIPFLQAKCKKYGLTASFAEMEQTDIYRQISPFKNLLKLSNCKQKSLEEFLGLNREDPFNGGFIRSTARNGITVCWKFCCCIMRMISGECSLLYPSSLIPLYLPCIRKMPGRNWISVRIMRETGRRSCSFIFSFRFFFPFHSHSMQEAAFFPQRRTPAS